MEGGQAPRLGCHLPRHFSPIVGPKCYQGGRSSCEPSRGEEEGEVRTLGPLTLLHPHSSGSLGGIWSQITCLPEGPWSPHQASDRGREILLLHDTVIGSGCAKGQCSFCAGHC